MEIAWNHQIWRHACKPSDRGVVLCCVVPGDHLGHNAAYYRGAMGILLVYDVTDEASFNNIRNWMRNIEQHASDNVNKVSQHSCMESTGHAAGVSAAVCKAQDMQLASAMGGRQHPDSTGGVLR